MDRLIQQAIHQVLNEIWDYGFSKFSYGFRPLRRVHHALKQAQVYLNDGYHEVIDLDLKSFFDRVNHNKLKRKIADPILLKLIQKYLKSGMMLGGVVEKRQGGTPQGSPLSPVLSNILLDGLDKELEN